MDKQRKTIYTIFMYKSYTKCCELLFKLDVQTAHEPGFKILLATLLNDPNTLQPSQDNSMKDIV